MKCDFKQDFRPSISEGRLTTNPNKQRSRSMKRTKISASILLGSLLGVNSSGFAQSEAVLEEIIVTGTKRVQNLRDVAATVNVVSGARLDDLNILTFEDLERVTSGVVLSRPNPRNTTISIRGVYYDPESGAASAVDVYQNGVTHVRTISLARCMTWKKQRCCAGHKVHCKVLRHLPVQLLLIRKVLKRLNSVAMYV